jgi:peptidoglycan hydrolase-like protein with peptidoglycan-binding domain
MQLPKGPTQERISEIQTALSRKGYYQGDPSGKWDSDTVAAVAKFQSDNHIDSSGKLDAPTLQKLGLGSDIAGVSAPKPLMPNASAPAPSTPSNPGANSASNATASHGGASSAAAVAPSSSSAATMTASPVDEAKPTQH